MGNWSMPRDMSKFSTLEADMLMAIHAAGLPEPQSEYRFDRNRRWRFDFAWPEYKLAVECEGGNWSGGRHTRGAGFAADTDKYNAASLQGWAVLRFTGDRISSGAAIQIVEQALRERIGP